MKSFYYLLLSIPYRKNLNFILEMFTQRKREREDYLISSQFSHEKIVTTDKLKYRKAIVLFLYNFSLIFLFYVKTSQFKRVRDIFRNICVIRNVRAIKYIILLSEIEDYVEEKCVRSILQIH